MEGQSESECVSEGDGVKECMGSRARGNSACRRPARSRWLPPHLFYTNDSGKRDDRQKNIVRKK